MSAQVTSRAAIALNRFGLGARPDDSPPLDPPAFLTQQFERYAPAPDGFAKLPEAGILVQTYQADQRARREAAAMAQGGTGGGNAEPAPQLQQALSARKDDAQQIRGLFRQAVQARMASALATDAPFVERLVHFWSNHFCVSADNPQVTAFAGAFERDAIRPHVLGRFEDMLMAVEQHPAMLLYLNQNQSIGPDSPAAQRASQHGGKVRGLNENLAREIMELHTLGVRSGYTQVDVTEFARALTGWSVDGLGARGSRDGDDTVGFQFKPQAHEPGVRTVLGKRYAPGGEEQASTMLGDFARAPQTATHIATKLARHFAGDVPPPALVGRLVESFTRTRGDLKALYVVLINSPECWAPGAVRFKSPWEWTVSALRGLGRADPGQLVIEAAQQQLGQPVWKPGSPAGWDDTSATWAAPDALLRRVELAQRLAAQAASTLDARSLAPKLLPGSLSPATAQQIERAESPAVALALLLVSPDFLRR